MKPLVKTTRNQPRRGSAIITVVVVCAVASLAFGIESAPPPVSHVAPTPEAEQSGDFVRFEDGESTAHLQTAIVHYRNRSGTIVDLVGAVHVGGKGYYAALVERFKRYDAVLFELVGDPGTMEARFKRVDPKKPEVPPKPVGKQRPKNAEKSELKQRTPPKAAPKTETPPPAPGKPAPPVAADLSMVAGIHQMVKKTLRLEFQLEAIDYLAPNFVHADVSMEEFARLRESRGESMLTLMARAIQAEIMGSARTSAEFGARDFLALFGLAGGADRLKYAVGRQMSGIEEMMGGTGLGEESAIIGDRNLAALKVLRRELAAGRKRLAVFYGAAHLPHMDKVLTEEMGFQRTGQEWLNAWDIDKTKLKPKSKPPEKPAAATEARETEETKKTNP